MFTLRRFWWKDARQFWPVALFLVLTAEVVQWLLLRYGGPEVRNGILGWLAIGWAGLYGCAVGAAAFAGEKETGTLRFLDTLPVSRRWLWTAKSSFAILSTIALGLGLFALAATGTTEWKLSPNPPPLWMVIASGMAFLAAAVSWGLFFSSITNNALVAATLTVVLFLCFTPLLAARIGFQDVEFFVMNGTGNFIVGGLMLAASGLVMTLSGPPRGNLLPWSLVRTRRGERAERADRAIMPVIDVSSTGSTRHWPHEIRSLVWQTIREGRGTFLWLVGLGLLLPLLLELTSIGISEPLVISLNLIAGLFAGIQTFGAENRGKTHRFLANQGARPGFVWLIKVSVWLGAMTLLWLPLWLFRGVWTDSQMNQTETFQYVIPTALALFSTIAVGQFCGMTIRRGITAGVVAIVVYLTLAFIQIGLVAGGMMSLGFAMLTPLAMLAVTWAWSGDWMLDRPGYGRWARLAGLVAGASTLLFSGYVGERVWGVAGLASNSKIVEDFRYDRSPVTPPVADNAAPIYLQATRAVKPFKAEATGDLKDQKQAIFDDPEANWFLSGIDAWDPTTLAWLHDNTEALALIRRASSLPSCEFKPIAGMPLVSGSSMPSEIRQLSRLLILSAADRQSKGDLAGAWDDLFALLRTSRHLSGPVPFLEALIGLMFDRNALKLALRWAADPRQKPETLRKAADDYRGLSKISIADTVRFEAEILNNTLELPRDELQDALAQVMSEGRNHSYGYGLTPWAHLGLVGLTTPWEVARARRLMAQLALFEVVIAKAEPGARWSGSPSHDEQADLQIFHQQIAQRGSPLLRFLAPNVMGLIEYNDRNEVARRAVTQIFALRIYQVEHNGKLPESLDQLMEAKLLDRLPTDPYGKDTPFGYAKSQGQNVLPIGDFEPTAQSAVRIVPLTATKGHYRLLFSIGPDRISQKATANEASVRALGDIIFPLRDGGEENAAKKDGPG